MDKYIIVFKVSTGIKKTLKTAAATEAKTVFITTGICLVKVKESKAAKVPLYCIYY